MIDRPAETATGLMKCPAALSDLSRLGMRDGRDQASESLLRSSRPANNSKIMTVDDEPLNIMVVEKHLRNAGYGRFVSTSDSREAVDLIRREQPDVIVLDIRMPHVTGLEILEVIRGDLRLNHLPVLILTAVSDEDIRIRAFEAGATDFLSKPVQAAELIPRVHNLLIVKAHHDQLTQYSERLEYEVRLRVAELTFSREELIHVLACAAEQRDRETGNHVQRVGRFAGIIARQLGFSASRVELITQAAVLHDVGKIGVPDAILLKRDRLNADERRAMHMHCQYGMNILNGMLNQSQLRSTPYEGGTAGYQSPILKLAATIAMSHHEKWDGSGYPQGLAGESIPVEGRITAVSDVFDALHSARPYKPALRLPECVRIIEEGRGSHFDPRAVDAFLAGLDELVRVSLVLTDE